MTFTELVDEVAERLNLTSSTATTRIGRSVNQRYKWLASSIGLATTNRTSVNAMTTIGSRSVVFAAEKLLAVYNPATSPITILDEISFDEMRHRATSTSDSPREYAIQLMGASTVTIYLDKTPETSYQLRADAESNLSTLSGSQVPAFPEDFHDVLIYGAMAIEYEKMEKPALAAKAEEKWERRLSDLRMFIAKSAYADIYQGKNSRETSIFGHSSSSGVGGGGGGETVVEDSIFNVMDYGAVGNNVINDTAAIALAQAALVARGGGVLYFPEGDYLTTGVITPIAGEVIAGDSRDGTTITYSGSAFWLDVGATTPLDSVQIKDMSVYCSGSALGVMRIGRTNGTFNNGYFRAGWSLKNLYFQHTVSPHVVGSIGISATQYINWTLDNVTINNFERAAMFDRGGNSTGTRVRFQSFKFGPKWTNNVGGCQDTYISPEFLGPTTTGVTAGTHYGYTCEIDAPFITFISALYETQPGGKSQGFLLIDDNGGEFCDYNGAMSKGAEPDATIVFADNYDHPKFIGTNVPVSGYPAIVFGTPIGSAGKAEFIGCSEQLNVLVVAQPTTKYTLLGSTTGSAFSLIAAGMAIKDIARADIGQDVTTNSERGIFWDTVNDADGYGIFRPAGAWADPYVQLTIAWQVGVVIDPGTSGSKSYVEILGSLLITKASGYIAFSNTNGGASAPSSGWRLFADTSGGKTRMVVRFPTGATQVLATEP